MFFTIFYVHIIEKSVINDTLYIYISISSVYQQLRKFHLSSLKKMRIIYRTTEIFIEQTISFIIFITALSLDIFSLLFYFPCINQAISFEFLYKYIHAVNPNFVAYLINTKLEIIHKTTHNKRISFLSQKQHLCMLNAIDDASASIIRLTMREKR